MSARPTPILILLLSLAVSTILMGATYLPASAGRRLSPVTQLAGGTPRTAKPSPVGGGSLTYSVATGSCACTYKGIWTMNSNGRQRTDVAPDGFSIEDCCASWTQDGSEMLYDSQNNKGYFEVQADGTGKTYVYVDGADATISPDGFYVAYVSGNAVWIRGINENASFQPRKLWTDTAGGIFRLAWTPDDESIIAEPPPSDVCFAIDAKPPLGACGLYRVPLNGQPAKQMAIDLPPNEQIGYYSISPSGTRVVFAWTAVSASAADAFGLYTAPLAGGPATGVPGTREGDTYPQWSPDGKVIAFNESVSVDGAFESDMFLIPARGGTPADIGISGQDSNLLPWRPTPQPHITRVLPTNVVSLPSGPAAGGQNLTLEGVALSQATELQFVPQDFGDKAGAFTQTLPIAPGDKNAVSIYVPSVPNLTRALYATAGGHKEGTDVTVDILVTYKTGKGTATTKPTSRDRYVFMMPELTGVSPGFGSLYGQDKITIRGKYLNGATRLSFSPAREARCTRHDPSPSDLDDPTVAVASIGQPDAAGVQQVVTKPTPSFEKTAKALDVAPECGVVWNVRVDVPVEGTCGRLDRLCTFLQSAKMPRDEFETIPLSVTSVSPSSGPIESQGKKLTIPGTGLDFGGKAYVYFVAKGPKHADVMVQGLFIQVLSDTEMTAELPDFSKYLPRLDPSALLDLTTDVIVEKQMSFGPAEYVQSLPTTADRFHVIGPAVTSVKPSKVSAFGGDTVVVTGHGFTGADRVEFLRFGSKQPISTRASESSASARVLSDNTLRFRTPNVGGIVAANKGSLPVHVVVEIPTFEDGVTIKSMVTVHDKLTFTSR